MSIWAHFLCGKRHEVLRFIFLGISGASCLYLAPNIVDSDKFWFAPFMEYWSAPTQYYLLMFLFFLMTALSLGLLSVYGRHVLRSRRFLIATAFMLSAALFAFWISSSEALFPISVVISELLFAMSFVVFLRLVIHKWNIRAAVLTIVGGVAVPLLVSMIPLIDSTQLVYPIQLAFYVAVGGVWIASSVGAPGLRS